MQNYSDFTDDILIKRIKSDDLSAFNELYNRYVDRLIHYVYGKVQDLDESEDIVQEIFVSLWLQRDSILELTSIASYLYKIALNKSLNIFKKEKVKDLYINSLASFLIEPSYDMLELNEEDEREANLKEALKLLPEKMRVVFEMRYFLGYSNQQVAEATGTSIHTVSTQMKRALKAIRENLGLLAFLFLINKI